jgi:hypothetical protein
MKLSEAMILGTGMTSETRWTFISSNGSCCALGAALWSKGHRRSNNGSEAIREWPWLSRIDIPCPACHMLCESPTGDGSTVKFLISHLHFTERWSRQHIAEWIATIEPQEETTEQPADQHTRCVACAGEEGRNSHE